jgi:hypothetical protein
VTENRSHRQAQSDDASALHRLHQEEMRLFGATADNDGSGGQGLVQVVLRNPPTALWTKPVKPPAGLIYLLGQGLYGKKTPHDTVRRITKDAISPCIFTIELIFRPNSQTTPQKQADTSLVAARCGFPNLGAMRQQTPDVF